MLAKLIMGACALAGCGAPALQTSDTPALPAVVTVWDGQPVPNVTPPQQLDILLDVVDEDAAEAERQCADMGGTVTWDDDLPAWRCQDVDY